MARLKRDQLVRLAAEAFAVLGADEADRMAKSMGVSYEELMGLFKTNEQEWEGLKDQYYVTVVFKRSLRDDKGHAAERYPNEDPSVDSILARYYDSDYVDADDILRILVRQRFITLGDIQQAALIECEEKQVQYEAQEKRDNLERAKQRCKAVVEYKGHLDERLHTMLCTSHTVEEVEAIIQSVPKVTVNLTGVDTETGETSTEELDSTEINFAVTPEDHF